MNKEVVAVKAKYAIDTCSLMRMRSVYPIGVFPSVWEKITDLADDGVIVSCEDVLEELKVQDDDLLSWAKERLSMFLPIDGEIQKTVARILKTHGNLLDLKRKKSSADPFLIAFAMINKCTVVTEEQPSGGPDKSKIPDVCKAYNVPHITLLELLTREGLKL